MSTEQLEAAVAKAAAALAAAAAGRETPPEQVAVLEQRWRQAEAAWHWRRFQEARQSGDLEAEDDALEDLRELCEGWC